MNKDLVSVEAEVGVAPSSKRAPILETPARPRTTAPAAATGRRKESVARVRIVPGTGEWTVNGRTLESYFPNKLHQQVVKEPFATFQVEGRFDVIARVYGGGITNQAGALRLGVAYCLKQIDTEANRPLLKKGRARREARLFTPAARMPRSDRMRAGPRSGGGGSSLPRMDLAYVAEIETSLRALHAHRVLDDIEEHRGVRDALQAGLTQIAIAKLLGKSQPTVHRIIRRLTVDPTIADRSPREVIALATAGEIDRSTMMAELAVLDPQPGAGPDEPYLDGQLAGDWDQVVEAWENGWLTDAEYDELVAR